MRPPIFASAVLWLASAAGAGAETFQHTITDLDRGHVYEVLVNGSVAVTDAAPDPDGVLRFETDAVGYVQVVPVGEGDAVAPGAMGAPELVDVDGTSAVVRFVAPGDDGLSGVVDRYDVRASLDSLETVAWQFARILPRPPGTVAGGEVQIVTLDGLTPGSLNYVAMRPVDDGGNRGPISAVVAIRAEGEAPGTGDGAAVAPPGVPRARFRDGSIFLSWTPSADPRVTGYHVYRREEDGARERLTGPPLIEPAFTDAAVVENRAYVYRLTAVDSGLNESPLGAEMWIRAAPEAPPALVLERIYPNPIRSGAVFRFSVPEFGPGHPEGMRVTIDLYDVAGRKMTRVLDEHVFPGTREVSWRMGTDGPMLVPGVYTSVLKAGRHLTRERIAVSP